MKTDGAERNAQAAAPGRAAPARGSGAWHRIGVESGYLRGELFNRQTLEETKRFLEEVLTAALEHGLPRVLICVRNSVPIFTLERYGFSHYLDLVFKSNYRIALVGDTMELRVAHQYIATLARIRGVRLRAFPEETSAIRWLSAGETSPH
jgi:hypothetical protein